MATKSLLLTLTDLLGPDDSTYTWHVPSKDRDVKLRRLTHGQVNQFNQDIADVGFNLGVPQDIKDRMLAAGLAEPAMTVEEIQKAPGNMRTAFEEIYQQIGRECNFLVTQERPEKPTVYVPGTLHEVDEQLLATQFTVVRGERPVEADADPLVSGEPVSTSS